MASGNTSLPSACSNTIGSGTGSSTSSPLTVDYNGRENGDGMSSPLMNGVSAIGAANSQGYHQLSVTSEFLLKVDLNGY